MKEHREKPSTTHASSSQTSIHATMYNATKYPTSSQRHKEITNAVTFFLAKDHCSINTVDTPGFKKLINTLDKRYNLPSRHYFSRVAIPALYDECHDGVAKEVATAQYFATTTDLWSSRTMEPYLSLTVHFIDMDFNMKTKCLQTSFFPEDHTGQNIAAGLKQALATWDLEEGKLVCITTDNAANVILAAQLNGWMRLQCFGHRLHLAIERAMKDHRIERAVGVCKKVVSTFSFSWKKKRELKKAQIDLKLPDHSLKTECPTRWGSRQAMVSRVLEQQKAIAHVLSQDKGTRHLIPSWQDIDVLEAINKTLGPLVEFTDALSGEKYVSVSLIKPTLHLFNNSILAEQDDDTDLSKYIKRRILEYLNEKYGDSPTQELLDMATVLDPRFKLRYVSEVSQETIKARLTMEMKSIMEAAVMGTPIGNTEVADDGASNQKKRKKGLSSFFKAPHSTAPGAEHALQLDKAIAFELQAYLQTGTLDTEEDPLGWWKLSQNLFPRLSILAKKYLGIPATSASSERVFSTGGNVVNCLRASLKPDHVNRLVFLAKNL
ncbi:E3 SUMO-protein ligase ZBED1-like [Simochromis diagramma]|uniref:E3 SUMO-protein ligase ZBED1-like n=1 Tax=Simochromis diagramma TaxID=43689 RepID=UPI001A7E45DC|nr:E3 SUMO-protein ligase ZBED1-like [Simochromis diagramma]